MREELMLTVAYICSHVPHSRLEMKTPFKRLYAKEADLSHLKIIVLRLSFTSRILRSWNLNLEKE